MKEIESWLSGIRRLDMMIAAKLEEKRRLREMAADVTGKPYDGMPFTNTGQYSDKVAAAVIKIVECEEEIDRLISMYAEQKKEILAVMEVLPEREYEVMHSYYILGNTWEQVADEVGKSGVQVWRLKNSALRRLADALGEKEEDGH
jgi:DNA-directed RNA polymerase specialized sigma subunit